MVQAAAAAAVAVEGFIAQAHRPTIHIEAIVAPSCVNQERLDEVSLANHQIDDLVDTAFQIAETIRTHLVDTLVASQVGTIIDDLAVANLRRVQVSDYTGPEGYFAYHPVEDVDIDVHTYWLHPEEHADPRRRILQSDDDSHHTRILRLPSMSLQDEWNSLVFDEPLPAMLLHNMIQMIRIMSRPGLKLSAFNLNRLVLLHGPSGSGKSTLCRALAQKLSIRLSRQFPTSLLVEINANAMLSKYFGESGKLIHNTFQNIFALAQPTTLVCVVIDEVETIAGSRERALTGQECSDGLRATNQLLTALDRVRGLPNVVVLCTSNLVAAIDPAFLDRVDVKQHVPRPSPAAIYDIFRSCLNELVSCGHICAPDRSPSSTAPAPMTIPTFAEANLKSASQPDSPASRVLKLAQTCPGLSGRTLRRLPILGLSMIWHDAHSLSDAVAALEDAVAVELGRGRVAPE